MQTFTALLSTLLAMATLSGRRRRGDPSAGDLGAGGPPSGTLLAREADTKPNDLTRQEFLVESLVDGHSPSWNSAWVPVRWMATDKDGVTHEVEAQVAPDYLTVGTDDDPLTAVLGYPNAMRLANREEFILPTSLLVDKIWQNAEKRYDPSPLPPTSGSTMRRPGYWLQHRSKLMAQGWPAGEVLQAGHKKDVVISRQLVGKPQRLAIYGWHQSNGRPIQPVSLFHGKDYADYSHGVRPVNPTVLVDGKEADIRDLLNDPVLWPLVSKEGPFDYAGVAEDFKNMAWVME